MAYALSPKDKHKIETVAGATVKEFILDLPKLVNHLLSSAVGQLLGLSHSNWNQSWSIDHCNGRRSVIIDLVERRCKEEIEAVAKPIVDITLAALQTDKRFLAAIAREVEEQYRRTLHEEVHKVAMAHAHAQAKALVQGLEQLDFSEALPESIDPTNPDSFDTDIGEAILQEVAHRLAKGKTGKLKRAKGTLVSDE